MGAQFEFESLCTTFRAFNCYILRGPITTSMGLKHLAKYGIHFFVQVKAWIRPHRRWGGEVYDLNSKLFKFHNRKKYAQLFSSSIACWCFFFYFLVEVPNQRVLLLKGSFSQIHWLGIYVVCIILFIRKKIRRWKCSELFYSLEMTKSQATKCTYKHS